MTGYVISNEQKDVFVCQDDRGAYSLTTDRDKALIWDTRIAAEAVFRSNLSKLIKSKGVSVRAVTLKMEQIPRVVSSLDQPEYGSSKYIISVLSDAVAKLNCRHTALVAEESKYDRQRTDVEHYIELNAGKLNAYEGYQAYKLLQDVLLERRKIKNELDILNVVMSRILSSDDIANINARVQEFENRTYVPREFKHLFE